MSVDKEPTRGYLRLSPIMTTFRSRAVAAAHELGGGTLVIHCSDPRYQPHFQDFVRSGLGIEHYGLIAVPGGVHALTLTEYLPKFSWASWRWLDFMAELTAPDRVVLLGHHDCRWYQAPRFHHLHGGTDDAQHDDLRRVKGEILRRLPNTTVETWFARLDGLEARFETEPS